MFFIFTYFLFLLYVYNLTDFYLSFFTFFILIFLFFPLLLSNSIIYTFFLKLNYIYNSFFKLFIISFKMLTIAKKSLLHYLDINFLNFFFIIKKKLSYKLNLLLNNANYFFRLNFLKNLLKNMFFNKFFFAKYYLTTKNFDSTSFCVSLLMEIQNYLPLLFHKIFSNFNTISFFLDYSYSVFFNKYFSYSNFENFVLWTKEFPYSNFFFLKKNSVNFLYSSKVATNNLGILELFMLRTSFMCLIYTQIYLSIYNYKDIIFNVSFINRFIKLKLCCLFLNFKFLLFRLNCRESAEFLLNKNLIDFQFPLDLEYNSLEFLDLDNFYEFRKPLFTLYFPYHMHMQKNDPFDFYVFYRIDIDRFIEMTLNLNLFNQYKLYHINYDLWHPNVFFLIKRSSIYQLFEVYAVTFFYWLGLDDKWLGGYNERQLIKKRYKDNFHLTFKLNSILY